jgi:transposase
MHSEPCVSHGVWECIPPEAQAYIRALEARGGALEETVQRLQAATEQLEATVKQVRAQRQQTSRPSSRPPSSEPLPAVGQRSRREPSGRRPGGQPGHEGPTRARRPVEEVDVVIPVKPERCPRGQPPWPGADPQPPRHHVTEIPPVKPVVTE